MLIPIPSQLYVRALIKDFIACKTPWELEDFCDMVDATLKHFIASSYAYTYKDIHALRHHYFVYLGSMYNRYKVSTAKDKDSKMKLCIMLGNRLYTQMYPLDSYKYLGVVIYDKDSKLDI